MLKLRAVAVAGAIMSVIGLGAASPALANRPLFKAGTYSGPTDQQHTIKFGADHHHLRALDTVIFTHCLDPSGTTTSAFHRVRTSHAITINNGHFTGSNVPLFDGGTAHLTGSLRHSSAQGSVQVSFSFNEGTDEHIVSCNGTMTWTAHFRHTGYPAYPVAKPPAVPNALFTGTNTQPDHQAISFRTTADGDHVDQIDATVDYECLDDGSTGWIHVTSGTDGGVINSATGHFDYSYNGPVSGLTDHAGFDFSGYFNTKFNGDGSVMTPGNGASGSMSVTFTRSDGAYCTIPNSDPSWSAHVSSG